MAISYSNPTSGPSAGGIGWFNFGNITVNPGDTLQNLTGTLNDGTIVKFNLSITTSSGTPRSFIATQPPVFPGANFGTTGYTGIIGNVALDSVFTGLPGTALITISNIVVTNPDSSLVPNYTVVIADSENTSLGEGWAWNTNGGGWKLLATLGSNPPTLGGLNTQTATILGTAPSGLSAAYVLTSQNPTQLALTTSVLNGTRQAFSIGFAVTKVTIQKSVGDRIDPSDQFVLAIGGTPSDQATTTGNNVGVQTEKASVFAIPQNSYTINESMAAGSASPLTAYTQIISASNATPAGSIPPTGNLPIAFTPALGDDVTYTIINAAPETFTKSVDKAFANIGDILTYSIVVNNPNNFAINNVLVSDATPSGTTYLGNITVDTAYTGTDLPTGITITTLAANSSATISWQVQVNSLPPVANPIPNFGMVTVPGGTSGMTNVVTTQVNTAFVTMNKMVDKPFAKTGDILTYTIMLNNAGNVAANNVVINDVLPLGTTYVPNSVIGATGTPPTLALLGSIAPTGNATVSFQVLVGDNIPSPNPIINSASATYAFTVDPANPNGATGNAESNTTSTQINEAIVTMQKSATPSFVDTGDIITYTILLQNTGNTDATNVIITDAIPAGTTFVNGSLVGATGTPPTLILTDPISANGSTAVSFQVQVGASIPTTNPILNSATSTFTFTVDPENPNGANGTSASNLTETPVNHASITTLKLVDKSYADTGDVITYTLQLQNTGNVAANNVVINDVIPVGTTFILGSLVNAIGTPPTLALTTSLAPQGSITVSFKVKVDEAIPPINPLVNQATTSFTYTVDPANPNGASGSEDSNTVSTQVNHAEIIAMKVVDKAYADLNDILSYTITLENIGNVTASNVILNDVIPTGTTYVANSLVGATGTLPNITLNAPIGAGATSTITFQVKVTSVPNNNPISNVVTAQYQYTVDPAQPNGSSAASTSNAATTEINHANLAITKKADKFISFLGDTITYQIAVTNTGNVYANNVVITDILAPGTSFVNGSLMVNVPYSGTPTTGITLTNPVAPGAIASISFKVNVVSMPLPNPIVNKAQVVYKYTVNPANPNGVSAANTSNPFSTLILRYNYQQQINDLIESVALQQAALAAIANAEGAKIQKVVTMSGATNQELLCINKSVADMLASIAILEAILKQKIEVVNCQIDGSC